MADSATLRTTRWRKHRAGDHSLCSPVRCEAAAPGVRAALLAAAEAVGPIDPAAEVAALARRLIAASEADPANTSVARALLVVLQAFPAPGEADPITAREGRVAARLAGLSAGVAGPAGARPVDRIAGGRRLGPGETWDGRWAAREGK